MQNLLNDLSDLLQQDDRVIADGKLLKNKLIELTLQLDSSLLKLLLSNNNIRNHFFEEVGDVVVFDKIKFQKFISNKEFLPDSHTAFKNKIGLTNNDEYISESKDVVISWPYKDCVLEGGQTAEEVKRKEIFWNEVLAPNEIDRLLTPKVFNNFSSFPETEDLISKVSLNQNYVIKGNNLQILHSIKKIFPNKIKLVCIDPPYNTGNDGFGYNDSFNHSSWLTFMKNRLEVLKSLMHKEGSVWITIDDDESHYLKVLCDEIFGRENFVGNVIWEKKYTVSSDAKYFSDNHDHILVYAFDKEVWRPNRLVRSEKMNKAYTNPDNHPKGPWKATPLQARSGSDPNFEHTFPNGVKWKPPVGRFSAYSHETLDKYYHANEIWFGKDGKAMPARKTFLSELKSEGLIPRTVWRYDEVGHNHLAKDEIKKIFGSNVFNTPKPEELIERIIHIATNPGDVVLDFFGGSGTTGAVAMKMGRQFILTEQMDYAKEVTFERIKKAIVGDNTVLSQKYSSAGKGEVIYMELAKDNLRYVEAIEATTTINELISVVKELKDKNQLSYRVDYKIFDEAFNTLTNSETTLEQLKLSAISLVDKNSMYIPYSEIEDKSYSISEQEKSINNKLYNLQK